ncbi:hypothetical protein IFM89_006120 [Coptis chinensis]|uniref:Magnesium transporter CorA-like family protein n=1 Tax=Coptis chinensis TaxID=261450 RepID=A0A835GUM6_9MAGN|nr:hypothetical protein IFM89_006120 [Coptis chinensis]
MQQKLNSMGDEHSASKGNIKRVFSRDVMLGSDLWKDGLICAFEFVRGHVKTVRSKTGSRVHFTQQIDVNNPKKEQLKCALMDASNHNMTSNGSADSVSLMDAKSNEIVHLNDQKDSENFHPMDRHAGSYWVPIGWARISELVQNVQVDAGWGQQPIEFTEDDDELTVADVAAPYWQQPAGPTWWCHVSAGHPSIDAWLNNAHWLHPAISVALRDESRLISERMKHLLYEVPVRVAGGLLFELLGQSAGDPFVNEDDIPVVLRSWQAQNFLVTALHIKGSASKINILGITEVQELLSAGGANAPRTVHEVIAHLASRLSRWDDRLFRKSIFGTADEVELKFMNRRNHEDMNLFSVIMNQEIRWLSKQVIRVKWSLHAREEIVFELSQHLRGNAARSLLDGIRKNTREMIEEQEAVKWQLVYYSRCYAEHCSCVVADFAAGMDRSLRVTHNLTVFGGCGLVLSIITGLFGINVDGMPGHDNTPYAFGLFTIILIIIGIVLIAIGLVYLGLKKPVTEEQVEVRKLELEQLVKMFQHEAETHAQLRHEFKRRNLSPTAADMLPDGAEYILIP